MVPCVWISTLWDARSGAPESATSPECAQTRQQFLGVAHLDSHGAGVDDAFVAVEAALLSSFGTLVGYALGLAGGAVIRALCPVFPAYPPSGPCWPAWAPHWSPGCSSGRCRRGPLGLALDHRAAHAQRLDAVGHRGGYRGGDPARVHR